MDSKCSDLIGLVRRVVTQNSILVPESLRKKGKLKFVVTVCTSVRLLLTVSIIMISTLIIRLQKSLHTVK